MQEVDAYREELIDELKSVGLTVYGLGIRKQEPPYVQLYPARENYIEIVHTTVSSTNWTASVTFDLTIIAGAEDRDSTQPILNEMIGKCLRVVRNLDDVTVEVMTFIDANGGRLLGANIGFSNEINIFEGEL